MTLPIQKCPLCLVVGPVVSSHILPKFLHRQVLRDAGENPVHFEDGRRHQSNKQHKEYLLCTGCEERIRAGGENYVAPLLVTGSNRHALIQDLTEPLSDDIGPIDGLKATGSLDIDKLIYFGLSIIWRAAVSTRQGFDQVRLGPYQETLRQYLHADDPEQLPSNMVVHLGYFDDPKGGVVQVTSSPETKRVSGGQHLHYLAAGGLEYRVFLGGHHAALDLAVIDVRNGFIRVAKDFKESLIWPSLVSQVQRSRARRK